jgi:hypothetical protein
MLKDFFCLKCTTLKLVLTLCVFAPSVCGWKSHYTVYSQHLVFTINRHHKQSSACAYAYMGSKQVCGLHRGKACCAAGLVVKKLNVFSFYFQLVASILTAYSQICSVPVLPPNSRIEKQQRLLCVIMNSYLVPHHLRLRGIARGYAT